MTSTAPTAGYVASPWRNYLRRGTAPVVLGMVLGVLLALALLQIVPKEYTAAARVQVTDTGLDQITTATNGRTTGTINLDTEAQLVTSAAVIHQASEADPELTNRYTYNKLVSRIAVTVPPNTTVLQIAYTDKTATDAQAGANALASAYLNDRQSTAQGQLDRQINSAQANRDSLTTQLQSLIGKAAQLPSGSSARQLVDTQIAFVKGSIRQINQDIITLQGIEITPGRIVSSAIKPPHPSSPSKTLYLASGLAVGLLLGLLAAWLRIRFRRRVRDLDDLAHIVDVPCVAVFHRADPTVVGALAAYRHLTVVVSTVVQPPARIVVTGPLVSSESSHVAAGLAAALTRRGLAAKVLEVHGDEVVAPELPSVVAERVLDADDVLTPGDASLPDALDRIRDGRAMLVIDAPGATVTADAQVMGAEADAVLLVVTSGTPSSRVRQAIAGLDSVGAPILGTVLVRTAEPAQGTGRPERPLWRAAPSDSPQFRPLTWSDESDDESDEDAGNDRAANQQRDRNGRAGQNGAAARRSGTFRG